MSWKNFFQEEQQHVYYDKLMQNVEIAYQNGVVYPPRAELFACFDDCPYEKLKVVIVGQDPYHGEGQANGLSFSVKKGQKIPPSLKNIYKEMQKDIGCSIPEHGDLSSWAKQGVLLMNTTWSVEAGKANSHKNIGWRLFTKHLLEYINEYEQPLVFILWGRHAQQMVKGVITNPIHSLIQSAHPSPLGAHAGFWGSRPFSQTNKILNEANREEIDWNSINAE